MKTLFFTTALVAGIIISGMVKAQSPGTDPNAPVITFDKDTIDYGTIARNSDGYRAFKFTNTGKEPLIIKNAIQSCGCTVPLPPKEPIQPGESSEIKVHYATDRVAPFLKTITVISNASNSPKIIVIKGTVLPDGKFPETLGGIVNIVK